MKLRSIRLKVGRLLLGPEDTWRVEPWDGETYFTSVLAADLHRRMLDKRDGVAGRHFLMRHHEQ